MSGFHPVTARSSPCVHPVATGCVEPTTVSGRSATVTGDLLTSQNSRGSDEVHNSLFMFLDDLAVHAAVVLSEHIDFGERCVACGSMRPCSRAVPADHNLEMAYS